MEEDSSVTTVLTKIWPTQEAPSTRAPWLRESVDTRCVVGALLAAGAAAGCFFLRHRRGRLARSHERDVLLIRHVASGDHELVAADVQQGADRLFRHALCLHVACSRIDGGTASMLQSLLAGPPALSAQSRQEGMQQCITRRSVLMWAAVDGSLGEALTGKGPYSDLLLGLPQCSPVCRLVRSARRAYDTQAVHTLDHFIDALAVAASTDGYCEGLDLNLCDGDGQTCLMLCVEKTGRASERFAESCLRVLLAAPTLEVSRGNTLTGATALHTVCGRLCCSGDPHTLFRCLQRLVSHPDASLNAQDKNNRTPLHWLVAGAAKAKQAAAAAQTRAASEADLASESLLSWGWEDLARQACELMLLRGASGRALDSEGTDPYVLASRHGLQVLCRCFTDRAAVCVDPRDDFTLID